MPDDWRLELGLLAAALALALILFTPTILSFFS